MKINVTFPWWVSPLGGWPKFWTRMDQVNSWLGGYDF